MELISNWKEKAHNRREEEIRTIANEYIALSDFDGKMYIAFQGNPLILVEDSLTTTEILNKLSEARNNYINAKLKEI